MCYQKKKSKHSSWLNGRNICFVALSHVLDFRVAIEIFFKVAIGRWSKLGTLITKTIIRFGNYTSHGHQIKQSSTPQTCEWPNSSCSMLSLGTGGSKNDKFITILFIVILLLLYVKTLLNNLILNLKISLKTFKIYYLKTNIFYNF